MTAGDFKTSRKGRSSTRRQARGTDPLGSIPQVSHVSPDPPVRSAPTRLHETRAEVRELIEQQGYNKLMAGKRHKLSHGVSNVPPSERLHDIQLIACRGLDVGTLSESPALSHRSCRAAKPS